MVVTNDITLTAKWTENASATVYTVTFHDGDTVLSKQSVESGKTTIQPNDPGKSGYTFVGWYDSTLTTKYDFSAAVTSNKDAYAKWTENTAKFVVTFNSKGGSAVDSQTIQNGKCVSIPSPAPEKSGYVFAGWYTDSACECAFNFATPITADMTLYAKWDKKNADEKTTHTVTFDPDGGVLSSSATQTVENGDKAVKPQDPTKDGYKFVAWVIDGTTDQFDFDNMAVTNDITLKATWVEVTAEDPDPTIWAVTFKDGSEVLYKYSVADGEKVQTPSNPNKSGYTFNGWFADEGLTKAFDFNTKITADTTVYAGYSEDKSEVVVKFETNGGSTVADQKLTKGSKAKKPANPTKKGYTFAGWFSDADCTQAFNFTTKVVSSMTLYAKWDEEKAEEDVKTIHTVVFDADGGKPEPADQQVVNGGKVKAPTSDPEKDGYVFLGWWLDDNTQFDFDTMTINNDTTLTAKWFKASPEDPDPTVYTVTFEPNGGSVTAGKQSVIDGGVVAKPDNPTKEFYEFGGWFSDKACTKAFDFNTKITADVTLYAKWTLLPLKVGESFTSGDGTYTVQAGQKSVYVKAANKKIKKFAIPTTVKDAHGYVYKVAGVAKAGFKKCKKLTKVTGGSSIKVISANAFVGCKKLKKVTINGNSLTTIGNKAFSNCKNLKKATFKSKNLKKIGKSAFAKTKKLTKITIKKTTKLKTVKKAFKKAGKNGGKKLVIKVKSSKKKAYKKLIRKKGGNKKVKIK